MTTSDTRHPKRPAARSTEPEYPTTSRASIHRRRFLAIVAGSSAAAVLGCGGEACDPIPGVTQGTATPPNPPPIEPMRTGGVPKRVSLETDNDKVRQLLDSIKDDAGTAAQDAPVKKTKKKGDPKAKPPHKLGGKPMKPDSNL